MDATIPPATISEDDVFTEVAAIARRFAAHVASRDSVDDVVQDVVLRHVTERRTAMPTGWLDVRLVVPQQPQLLHVVPI